MPTPITLASTQLQSRLFRLPRELRDLIYYHYLYNEAGLTYNFYTNKLHVNLSLMYTCRAAALELRGLALRLNKVVFCTTYPNATRATSGIFHKAFDKLHVLKFDLLNLQAPHLMTEAIKKEVSLKYPQFSPVLATLGTGYCRSTLGEPASTFRDFVHFTLNLLYDRKYNPTLGGKRSERRRRSLRKINPEPWSTPNEGRLPRGQEGEFGYSTRCYRRDLAVTLDRELQQLADVTVTPDRVERVKYCLSAAACAIRFLRSLRAETREHVRNVELIENRESIAFPECHGRGFIPFCREQPKLRVHRRVSLWRNVFPVTTGLSYSIGGQRLKDDRLVSSYVSSAVAKWMAEASALPSLGMPEGSFKLTLECDSAPEETTEVFNVVQRDAAWQTALDLSYARHLLPQPDWRIRRLRSAYLYEAFPKLLEQVTNGDHPFIHCDFHPGTVCDPEDIIRERRGDSSQQWHQAWFNYTPGEFQTPANMPPWHKLRAGYIVWDVYGGARYH
ncbi:uncharacterized protein J4E79_008996 [Alternaria viburni]|uniref:uncharacterized protein n=1 Tax=Alternaria viburni TaxID=566460 RepID=UPI0020C52FF3|nr:uncharacterized protein J4E79_008996 [Alternaria viburni]KAI4652689.1 hypothetical protein J4E79_008996 [Alternaria viburni]